MFTKYFLTSFLPLSGKLIESPLLPGRPIRSANVGDNYVAVADLRYMNDNTLRPALWRDVAYHMPHLALISRSRSLQALPRPSADFRNGCHGVDVILFLMDSSLGGSQG